MKRIIFAIVVLSLVSLACGFQFNIPSRATPGPDITQQIAIADPKSSETRLELSFGAGSLKLSPGAQDFLVDGTVTYNIPEFKPQITTNGGDIQIKQGEYTNLNLTDIKNVWDLKLGEAPMELTVNAGAYSGTYEFGGLALKAVTIKDGAANVNLSFSAPNLTEMSVFRYETGASSVNLSGLANANFSTMSFKGGAGDYTLDFSGDLQRDATVQVDTGFTDLQLTIPKGLNARVTVEGGAVNVNHSSGWAQNGHDYTQQGDGPSLLIIVKSGAGNVTITD